MNATREEPRDLARTPEALRRLPMATGRTLAVNVGNTSLFAGVFEGAKLSRRFRLSPAALVRLAKDVRGRIEHAAVCSVVPALLPDVVRLIRRAWDVEAKVLTAESRHGLRIAYRRPKELGADRVAAALGARERFPGKNVIVVDCGTATTVTALQRDGVVLGGAILPGAALWPEVLATRTAQLPRTPVLAPRSAIGRSPHEAIASGCYFGQVGAIREVMTRVRREAFGRADVVTIGTGGHAALFGREKLFDVVVPELVLIGLAAFSVGVGSRGERE